MPSATASPAEKTAYLKAWQARNRPKWLAYRRQWARDRKALVLCCRAVGATGWD